MHENIIFLTIFSGIGYITGIGLSRGLSFRTSIFFLSLLLLIYIAILSDFGIRALFGLLFGLGVYKSSTLSQSSLGDLFEVFIDHISTHPRPATQNTQREQATSPDFDRAAEIAARRESLEQLRQAQSSQTGSQERPSGRTDPYETLGISRDSDNLSIKKAYRRLAMKYHSDRNIEESDADRKASEEIFKLISAAYEQIKKMRGFK